MQNRRDLGGWASSSKPSSYGLEPGSFRQAGIPYGYQRADICACPAAAYPDENLWSTVPSTSLLISRIFQVLALLIWLRSINVTRPQ